VAAAAAQAACEDLTAGILPASVWHGRSRPAVSAHLSARPGKTGRGTRPATHVAQPSPTADGVPDNTGGPCATRVLVYLANTISREGEEGGRSLPYSIVAGIDALPGGRIAADEIVLNAWAAEDLDARPGDRIRLIYAERRPNGELAEVGGTGSGTVFALSRVVPTAGLGADPTLTPPFKGLTDATTVARWDPPPDFRPFFHPARIRDRDEAYWQTYQAAPKAFISLATAQRLWGSALGRLTSIRVPFHRADAFEARLRQRLDPRAMGMTIRPIKAQQLASASGSTDFGRLFVGFSLFLIVSAALLVGLLFRLAMERRARQMGLMLSVGFGPRAVRRIHLAGGMLLAVVGGLAGLAAAVGYAWLMLAGLRTWWVGAVGSAFARLHVEPVTLGIGYIASLAVSYVTIRWAVHRIGRTPPSVLLAGGFRTRGRFRRRAGRAAPAIAGACGAMAGAFLVMALTGVVGSAVGFFGAGALFLAAALAGLAAWLGRGLPKRGSDPFDGGGQTPFSVSMRGVLALERLGVRNAGRHPTRSVLTAGLIASAAFVIVTVAAMRRGEPTDTLRANSGAGGFNLILEADIPIERDLALRTSRDALAVADIPDGVEFVSLRASDGEDVSCLNLFRPRRPRILAVPDDLIDRAPFAFAEWEGDVDNPWTLLGKAGVRGQGSGGGGRGRGRGRERGREHSTFNIQHPTSNERKGRTGRTGERSTFNGSGRGKGEGGTARLTGGTQAPGATGGLSASARDSGTRADKPPVAHRNTPSRGGLGHRAEAGTMPAHQQIRAPHPNPLPEGERGTREPLRPEGESGTAESLSLQARGGHVPVIADAETARWILHLRLGETLTITDESGRAQRLRLVALLESGIFQGELLMGQSDFARLFPSRTGFKTVLVRADPRDGVDAAAVKRALERDLADFGVAVDWTADRLALFAAVAGTYLSTFQTLGGLGLLLGTVGVGVVLLRGLFERRGELALMSALGFRRRAVLRTVLAENAFLLVAGLGCGTASALVAVAPHVASGTSRANWLALAGTLAGIVAVGLAVLVAAVAAGLRSISVADLRAE